MNRTLQRMGSDVRSAVAAAKGDVRGSRKKSTRKQSTRKQSTRSRNRRRRSGQGKGDDSNGFDYDEDGNASSRKRKGLRKQSHKLSTRRRSFVSRSSLMDEPSSSSDEDDDEKRYEDDGIVDVDERFEESLSSEDDDDELERRRKEAQQYELEAQRALALEAGIGQPKVSYSTDMKHSREKWMSIWSFLKALFFFLNVMGGALIVTKNYDKRLCMVGILGSQLKYCLHYNKTNGCTGLEDAFCREACVTQRGSAEGCTYFLTDKRYYTCQEGQSSFKALCEDKLTCLSTDEGTIKKAVVITTLVMLCLFITEVISGVGLMLYSGFRRADFDRISTKTGILLLAITKNGGTLTQVMWGVALLCYSWLVTNALFLAGTCANGVTSKGTPNTFSDDVILFISNTGISLSVSILVGSVLRHKVLLRGELYNPSNDDEIQLTEGLTCAKQRIRDTPRCCPKCFEGCTDVLSECYMGWCAKGTGILVDWICSPCIACGSVNQWLFKHRHFIGP